MVMPPERDKSGVFRIDLDTSNGLNGRFLTVHHPPPFFLTPCQYVSAETKNCIAIKISTVVSSIQDTAGLF